MAELLRNLPSRGLLDPEAGPLIGRAPESYIGAFGASAAPQVIKSAEPNILISCLEKRKQEAAAKKKQKSEKQPAEEKRKRPQEDAGSSRDAAKKQNTGPAFSPQQLRTKSNQELSDILKQRGLPWTGRKDALVDRILNAQK